MEPATYPKEKTFMPSNHANIAAAQSAGHSVTRHVIGPTFITTLEKWISTGSGSMHRARGESTVDSNTADANALAALNEQRNIRYGRAAAGGNLDNTGHLMTVDGS
jgi:hypothetical protein